MSDFFWQYFFQFLAVVIGACISTVPVLFGIWLTYKKASSADDKAGKALAVGAEAKSTAVAGAIINQMAVTSAAQAGAIQDKETRAAIAGIAAKQEAVTQAVTEIKGVGGNEHLKEQATSYREIAEEAVANLELVRDIKMTGDDHPKPPIVAPIVPEHHSPSTRRQREVAALQTVRARLVAATLQLGLPPRQASPDAVED